MTETVLDYPRAIVPQETGWWCGPASTQVVLHSIGIALPESQIAAEIEQIENPGRGDDRDGTDYIGLIEQLLDRRVPDRQYTSVYLGQDPPSQRQKELFWQHLTQSIVQNRSGVIANIVAPPTNPPRAVKGSIPPPYPRYVTTFHYISIMGVDDTPGARAVWIADSAAFGGVTGFWCPFDGPGSICSLIPPKGYCYAAAGQPIVAVKPVAVDDPVAVLAEVMGGSVSRARYAALLPALSQCLTDCGATTADRIAMWCAQIGHESGGLKWMEELADGSAYEGRADLGNTRPGDGRRFKGRGPIQITGRANYSRLSEWAFVSGMVPAATYFVDRPEELASDRYGFVGVTWYWTVARRMNSFVGDIVAATLAVNGGLNGLDDRTARWERAKAMGERLCTLAAAPKPAAADLLEEIVVSNLRVPSLSIYAAPGEPDVLVVDMIRALDAHGPHEPHVEARARLGDPDAIARIARTAAGKGKFTDPTTIAHATAQLAAIPEQHLTTYLQGAAS